MFFLSHGEVWIHILGIFLPKLGPDSCLFDSLKWINPNSFLIFIGNDGVGSKAFFFDLKIFDQRMKI